MERPRLLSSLDTGALRDSILVGIFRGSRAGSQIFEKKANIGFCPAALARFMCGLTRIPRSPCAARRVCGSVGVRLCRVRVGGARIVSSFVCCVVKLYVTAPSQVNAAFSARWVPLGRATTTPYVDSVQCGPDRGRSRSGASRTMALRRGWRSCFEGRRITVHLERDRRPLAAAPLSPTAICPKRGQVAGGPRESSPPRERNSAARTSLGALLGASRMKVEAGFQPGAGRNRTQD